MASHDFPQFAESLYGSPGVEKLCLALQDLHGFDVNLLLFAAWASAQARSLTPEQWKHCDRAAQPFRDHAIWPIRHLRRTLSANPELPPDLRASLKKAILEVEIQAEVAEERALEALLPSFAPSHLPAADLLHANLAALSAAPWPPALTEFEALARAVILGEGRN